MGMSPFTLRLAYTASDYTFTVTCDALGSDTPMGDWTLTAALYTPLGVEVTDDITLTVVDADELTLSVTVAGEDLDCGDYPLVVTRTDAGEVGVVYTGTLEVTDPTNQLGWGRGME